MSSKAVEDLHAAPTDLSLAFLEPAIVYFAPEILIANIGVSQNMALILSGVGAISQYFGCVLLLPVR